MEVRVVDLNKAPSISYPTQWQYCVIFSKGDFKEPSIENIAIKLSKIIDDKFQINISKENTKYISVNMTCIVNSDEHRLKIFNKLKKCSKFIL